MRIILILLFLYSPVFGQNNTIKEISYLQSLYKDYIVQLYSSDPEQITNIENKILQIPISPTNITWPDIEYTFTTPRLSIFQSQNTLSNMNIVDRKILAQNDLAKLNASLFLLTNITKNYKKYFHKDQELFYKNSFINSEKYLLYLAKKALNADPIYINTLDKEFNIMISYLSSFPFPMEYSFYRRRMMYSIAFPEAAQDQINRLTQSISSLNIGL